MRFSRSKKSGKSVGLDETKTQLLFENGVDEHSRTLIITGEITEDTLFHIDTAITHLEKLSLEPINIRLSTCGGDIFAGNGIIDRLLISECEINIHAYGEICSMGIFILAAGDYKTSGILTSYMHHEDSYDLDNRHSHNKNYVKAMENIDQKMCKWLATRTKKDYHFWKRTGVDVDHWFSAENALEYGLIDDLID